jgi:hypothetical protein
MIDLLLARRKSEGGEKGYGECKSNSSKLSKQPLIPSLEG